MSLMESANGQGCIHPDAALIRKRSRIINRKPPVEAIDFPLTTVMTGLDGNLWYVGEMRSRVGGVIKRWTSLKFDQYWDAMEEELAESSPADLQATAESRLLDNRERMRALAAAVGKELPDFPTVAEDVAMFERLYDEEREPPSLTRDRAKEARRLAKGGRRSSMKSSIKVDPLTHQSSAVSPRSSLQLQKSSLSVQKSALSVQKSASLPKSSLSLQKSACLQKSASVRRQQSVRKRTDRTTAVRTLVEKLGRKTRRPQVLLRVATWPEACLNTINGGNVNHLVAE